MAKQSPDLVIVESPSKAKTIGKYLGPEFQVKACMGHLRDLPKSTMGVDLEHDFAPEYIPMKEKSELIRELKKAADKADTVYLATDPDREGEAISWHIKELLQLPDEKTRRVTFNEITKGVVTKAIRQPRGIDLDLVDAQQARRILDRIVGYQLSPLLLGGGGTNGGADASLLGGGQVGGPVLQGVHTLLQSGSGGLVGRLLAALSYQLVKSRHSCLLSLKFRLCRFYYNRECVWLNASEVTISGARLRRRRRRCRRLRPALSWSGPEQREAPVPGPAPPWAP